MTLQQTITAKMQDVDGVGRWEKVELYIYKQQRLYLAQTAQAIKLNDVIIWERSEGTPTLPPPICYCDICGKFEIENNLIREGGRAFCRSCYDDLPVCGDCGQKLVYGVSRVYAPDGETVIKKVCENCRSKYRMCEHCGKLYKKIEGIYCNHCLTLRKPCDICGELYFDDYLQRTSKGEYICTKCNPRSFDYFHTRRQTFVHLDTPKDRERAKLQIACGFELEVEPCLSAGISTYPNIDIRHALRNFFHHYGDIDLKYDGSLNTCGFEIATVPHTFEALRALPFDDMLNYLSSLGYRSHEGGNCGLHLHISRKAFGKTKTLQDYNIAKLLFFIDWYWEDIVKLSRRQDFSYCQRIATLASRPLPTQKQKRATEIAKQGIGDRYYAVNLENALTIEFRFMRGTLAPSTFKACIDFLLVISRRIKKVKYNDILCNPELVLKGIDKNTLRYLKRRSAFVDIWDKIETRKDNYNPRRPKTGGGKIND